MLVVYVKQIEQAGFIPAVRKRFSCPSARLFFLSDSSRPRLPHKKSSEFEPTDFLCVFLSGAKALPVFCKGSRADPIFLTREPITTWLSDSSIHRENMRSIKYYLRNIVEKISTHMLINRLLPVKILGPQGSQKIATFLAY